MARIFRFRILAVLAALSLTGCVSRVAPPPPGPVQSGALAGVIWDVGRGRAISPEELAAGLDAADLVILGEVHDNPTHHARQAWAVRAIRPEGLAFEMVPEAREAAIAEFRAAGGAPGDLGREIGWDELGWPDWSMYAGIIEAAPSAVVTGGGVSREVLRQAMSDGAAAAHGPGGDAAGLADPLPPGQQAAAEAEMVASHCGMLPAERAAPMVEAQRLRDARFAAALLRAAEAGGGQAALITGNGHARKDRGVPIYLARLAPDQQVVSLGQIEVRPGADRPADHAEDGALPYDYVWFSEPLAGRKDPCAAMREG